ncbi:MAG: carbamate kinase [Megasphaera sp.]|jgi:carbamate kinase|nr:carbamate kinase [Megasphaera sp.]MCH4187326.1 carbamate kinase [Megasphaera sp.]MCH4217508.1 carbamate kinase [Megasphaera sp.]
MNAKKKKRIVIALGGNALGSTLTEQMTAAKKTAKAIIDLLQEGCEVIVTHGNGPQVGMINHAMAALSREDQTQPNTPLSVCVAMSQAYIGYDLQNALREEMYNRDIFDIPVATMVTQVRVDPEDPAFDEPTKPIGHFMTKDQAAYAARKYGYVVKEDAGRGYRRVVASPLPQEIIEIGAIETLVNSGQLVIACGGGGIPVMRHGNHLKGASAVIDKDFVSERLAEDLHADYLIILTAVEKVAIHFGQPTETWLEDMTTDTAKKYMADGEFAAGSMLPKVQAAVKFAESKPGRTALITLLSKARAGILGQTGTRIHLP